MKPTTATAAAIATASAKAGRRWMKSCARSQNAMSAASARSRFATCGSLPSIPRPQRAAAAPRASMMQSERKRSPRLQPCCTINLTSFSCFGWSFALVSVAALMRAFLLVLRRLFDGSGDRPAERVSVELMECLRRCPPPERACSAMQFSKDSRVPASRPPESHLETCGNGGRLRRGGAWRDALASGVKRLFAGGNGAFLGESEKVVGRTAEYLHELLDR